MLRGDFPIGCRIKGPAIWGDPSGSTRRFATRRGADAKNSYTAKLLSGTVELPARKVGEEAQEVVLAAVQGQRDKLPHEAADLLYHLLVLLEQQKVPLADVLGVLRERMK